MKKIFIACDNHKVLIILLLIVFAGFILRSYHVSTNPPSLYWDEVSQGNNAYSILKTGRDEHQILFPIESFIAYGDYKAPVYIYLDVPFIALLGKTALAVRLPSVLFGTLSILACFFLVRELFYTDKKREFYALLSSFFLSISPWHIQLSRAAYEANIATFFTILGVFLFFFAKRKNAWFYIFSGLSFVLGIYAFNAHRVFIPLLGLLLLVIYYKDLWKKKKEVMISIVFCLIILLPFFHFLSTPESKLRYNEVNIFSDTTTLAQSNQAIAQEGNTLISKMIHNRRVAYSLLYLKHYFDFYTPDFLFIHGDVNPRFSLQENGELYLFELPLILIGIYILLKKPRRTSLFILGWLLLAPVAGATARETPHALRGETFLPLYSIFSAPGLAFLYSFMKRFSSNIRKLGVIVFCVIVAVSLFFFQYVYYVDYPYLYSEVWQDGYKETIARVEKIKSQYDRIIFTNHYGRAYAYVLFYGDITPTQFWENSDVKRDIYGLYNVSRVGKYQFPVTFSVNEDNSKKTLYVGAPNEIPNGMKVLSKVYLKNGHVGFVIATKLL